MNDISSYDDVARMFREHDDIGSDSSLWLHSLVVFDEFVILFWH